MLHDAIEGVAEAVTGYWGIGLVAVAGGALLASKAGRPAAKGALRGWFALRDRTAELGTGVRTAIAETGERIQDLYAEARAEVAGEETAPVAAARPAGA
jgi:hypothetical protein